MRVKCFDVVTPVRFSNSEHKSKFLDREFQLELKNYGIEVQKYGLVIGVPFNNIRSFELAGPVPTETVVQSVEALEPKGRKHKKPVIPESETPAA